MSEATASPAIPEDIAKLSFEEALGQLETLRTAEERIEKITLNADGRPAATPTEIE